jgi:hypothetical protein
MLEVSIKEKITDNMLSDYIVLLADYTILPADTTVLLAENSNLSVNNIMRTLCYKLITWFVIISVIS